MPHAARSLNAAQVFGEVTGLGLEDITACLRFASPRLANRIATG